MIVRPPTPPGLAQWLLRVILPSNVVGRTIAGDLREEFGRRAARIPNTARTWYLREAWSVGIHALKDRVTQRAEWGRATAVSHTTNREKESIMPQVVRDLRYAVRTLSRAKGFTAGHPTLPHIATENTEVAEPPNTSRAWGGGTTTNKMRWGETVAPQCNGALCSYRWSAVCRLAR